MPWNNSCANAQIAEIIDPSGGFLGYGTNGACEQNLDQYLLRGYRRRQPAARAIAPPNDGGSPEAQDFETATDCQGYPKPSWQSAYGVPTDGARDVPDVSLFAANGDLGSLPGGLLVRSELHLRWICDLARAHRVRGQDSAEPRSPRRPWRAFRLSSIKRRARPGATPIPSSTRSRRASTARRAEAYLGSACNSSGSGGPASSCVFNDVTEGDIVGNCNYEGISKSNCFGYTSSTFSGATNTDNITALTLINGGSGYTTASLPTCTIAGPSNAGAYKAPLHPAPLLATPFTPAVRRRPVRSRLPRSTAGLKQRFGPLRSTNHRTVRRLASPHGATASSV